LRLPVAVAVALFALIAASVALAAPTTAITFGPVGDSGLTTPTFQFKGGSGAESFECSLDGAPYSACASPQRVGPLIAGKHTFRVRAIDAKGAIDKTPATRSWTYIASPLGSATVKLRRPAKATMSLDKFRTISGTAHSASPISRVQVALQTGGPDKDVFPPACNFWDAGTGLEIIRPCLLPAYTTVTGTTSWHYKVPAIVRKRLKPHRYTLIVRVFNAFQQATQMRYTLTLR
jgi:hypothetical protein